MRPQGPGSLVGLCPLQTGVSRENGVLHCFIVERNEIEACFGNGSVEGGDNLPYRAALHPGQFLGRIRPVVCLPSLIEGLLQLEKAFI